MSVFGGPKTVAKESLLLAWDARHPLSMSGAGCGGFEGHDEGMTDIMDPTRKAKFMGDARVWGNVNFWTMVGISYPEGNYGGGMAGRDGLTAGYNNFSSGKTYDFTRDMLFFVWDQRNAAWISDSYFNGERISGHCYDVYENPSTEVQKFFDDFTVIKKRYPKALYILGGSHANQWSTSYFDSTGATQAIIDLGAPSSVDSWGGWKEWCMVGAPGLGAGNAYGFAVENGPTNPGQVGHLNFRVPSQANRKKGIYGGDKAVDFDGSGDYLDLGSDITFKGSGGWTVESWVRPESVSSGPYNIIGAESISYNSWYWSILSGKLAMWDLNPGNVWKYGNTTLSAGQWYHTVLVGDPSNSRYYIYLNGEDDMSSGWSSYNGSWQSSKAGLMVRYFGRSSAAHSRYWDGQISSVKIYNRALSAAEVKKSFNRGRHRT